MQTVVDFIFLTITYSAGVLIVTLVTTLSVLTFIWHNHKARAIPLLVSVGGSAISIWIVKYIFDTPRPSWALYTESSPAFPSGHAGLAMALYGSLFLSIYQHGRHPLQNKTLLMLALLIVLVGVSRVYLGVHYISDVLVGYAIGLIWIFLANAISKTALFRAREHRE